MKKKKNDVDQHSAAGKLGAASRWKDHETIPTKLTRIYKTFGMIGTQYRTLPEAKNNRAKIRSSSGTTTTNKIEINIRKPADEMRMGRAAFLQFVTEDYKGMRETPPESHREAIKGNLVIIGYAFIRIAGYIPGNSKSNAKFNI